MERTPTPCAVYAKYVKGLTSVHFVLIFYFKIISEVIECYHGARKVTISTYSNISENYIRPSAVHVEFSGVFLRK